MWLLSNCNPEVDFADLRIQQQVMIPVVDKITRLEDNQGLPEEDISTLTF
jgi:hypothetical protein